MKKVEIAINTIELIVMVDKKMRVILKNGHEYETTYILFHPTENTVTFKIRL